MSATIPFAVLMLSLIAHLLIHEIVHIVAARRAKVGVQELGLGWPPRLLTLGRLKGITITLNLIPIGAFVRMAHAPDSPDSIHRASTRARLFIYLSAPLVNILLGAVALFIAYTAYLPVGREFEVVVKAVVAGSPADKAGLAVGDVIVSAGDVDLRIGRTSMFGQSPLYLGDVLKDKKGELVHMRVLRPAEDGSYREQVLVVSPDPRTGRIGVETVLNVRQSAVQARDITGSLLLLLYDFGVAAVDSISFLFNPDHPSMLADSLSMYYTTDPLIMGLRLFGVIGMAIGMFNLLPFLPMDGGRALFAVISHVLRSYDVKLEGALSMLGLVWLLIAILRATRGAF